MLVGCEIESEVIAAGGGSWPRCGCVMSEDDLAIAVSIDIFSSVDKITKFECLCEGPGAWNAELARVLFLMTKCQL